MLKVSCHVHGNREAKKPQGTTQTFAERLMQCSHSTAKEGGRTCSIGTARSVTSSSSSLATRFLKAKLMGICRRPFNRRVFRRGKSAEEDSLTIPMALSDPVLTTTGRISQCKRGRQYHENAGGIAGAKT